MGGTRAGRRLRRLWDTMNKFKKGGGGRKAQQPLKAVDVLMLNVTADLWTAAERKQRLAQEEQMPLEQIHESKLLVKCFVSYCREQVRCDVQGGDEKHISVVPQLLGPSRNCSESILCPWLE